MYTSGTHAQAHTRVDIASDQHRMMEVGVGGEGVDGRWEEKGEVEMEVGGGSKGWEVGGEGGGGSRSTGGRCDVRGGLWMGG